MSPEFHHRVLIVGWTLVHSVWELAVIGALFGLALLVERAVFGRSVRRGGSDPPDSVSLVSLGGISGFRVGSGVDPRVARRASVRYALAALALLACAVAPIGTFCFLSSSSGVERAAFQSGTAEHLRRSEGPVTTGGQPLARGLTFPAPAASSLHSSRPGASSTANASHVSATTQTWRIYLDRHMPLVVSLWVAGLVVMCLRIVGGLLVVHRQKKLAWRGAPEWQERLGRLTTRSGFARPIQILFSATLDTPVVIGILRATILFPASALTSLSMDQIEALLAHELAHVLRHDFLVNLIQSAVEAALFFHPVVWWISSILRKERELCCDDIAVKVVGDPVGYASALASLESFRTLPPRLAMQANGGQLMRRIERIVSTPQPASAAGFAWLPLLAAIALSGGTAGTVALVRPDLAAKPVALARKVIAVAKSAMAIPAEIPERAAPTPTTKPAAGPEHAPRPPLSATNVVFEGRHVSGIVLSSLGAPVPNAEIVLTVVPISRDGTFSGKADSQGKFDFSAKLKPDQTPLGIYAFRKGEGLGRIGLKGVSTLQNLTVKLLPSTRLRVKMVDSNGNPLAGVKAKPEWFRGSLATGEGITFDLPDQIANEQEAQSGPDGIATVEDLPQDFTLRLALDSDTYIKVSPLQDIPLPASPLAEATMALDPGAVIEGRLLRDGKGVAGQQVCAYGGHDENSQGWTDENGSFRLPRLSAGSYVLFAQLRPQVAETCAARGLRVQLEKGELRLGADLVLTPGVLVSGTVTGSDGKPLKDVDVDIHEPDPLTSLWSQGTKTDAFGKYHLRVPAGKQEATFLSMEHWRHGDPRVPVSFEVAEGESKVVNCQLPAVKQRITIRGTVVGPNGAPVANAIVTAQQTGPNWTRTSKPDAKGTTTLIMTQSFTMRHFEPVTTGPDGAFSMEFDEEVAQSVEFRATKDDLVSVKPAYPTNGQVRVYVQDHVWATIEGDLVDPDGKPVPNETVTLIGFDDDVNDHAIQTSQGPLIHPSRGGFLGAAVADANGHFKFTKLLPMNHVSVHVARQGAGQGPEIATFAATPGGYVKTGPIVVEFPDSLSVVVVDGNEREMAGVGVAVEGRADVSATTDAHGAVRIRHLEPGRVRLTFTFPNRPPLTVEVTVGSRTRVHA